MWIRHLRIDGTMKIVETILAQISGISKTQQKFILGLFSTIFILYGKVNFTNLSRYSNLSEKTYRRQFSKSFPFRKFNQYLIQQALTQTSTKIAAIDCSFIPKSGNQTYGRDYFFNGCAGQPEKGLEVSVISVIDIDKHLGYTLSVEQTPAQKSQLQPSPKAKKRVESLVKNLLRQPPKGRNFEGVKTQPRVTSASQS